MKSAKFFCAIIYFLATSAFSQDMQYVSEKRGDTLWVKDDVEFEYGGAQNYLMRTDTLAPAGRVYVLKNGGIYSLMNNPVSSPKHRTIIMGESESSV